MQKMTGMVGLEENAGSCLLMNMMKTLSCSLTLVNARTENSNCMLKMCSLQVILLIFLISRPSP